MIHELLLTTNGHEIPRYEGRFIPSSNGITLPRTEETRIGLPGLYMTNQHAARGEHCEQARAYIAYSALSCAHDAGGWICA